MVKFSVVHFGDGYLLYSASIPFVLILIRRVTYASIMMLTVLFCVTGVVKYV